MSTIFLQLENLLAALTNVHRATILTKPRQSALEKLLAWLPPDKPQVSAPVLSVGVEGSGPASRVDEEVYQMSKVETASRDERQYALVRELEERKHRTQELVSDGCS